MFSFPGKVILHIRSSLPDGILQQFKITEWSLFRSRSPLHSCSFACTNTSIHSTGSWTSLREQQFGAVLLRNQGFLWGYFSAWSAPQAGFVQGHSSTRQGMEAWGWCKRSSPALAGQQIPQHHTCSVNENLAICVSARAEAPHPFKNLLGTQDGGRNTDCTQHWMQVYIAATRGFFHTSTSDFLRYMLQVNCTDPIPSLPKFSSPTFQLASQHCSKWRIE